VRLYTDSRGSNFVEYAIILGVVALLGIGAFATFGGSVTAKLGRQGERVAAMEGRVRSLDSMRPGEAAATESARAEKSLAAKSNDGWASNGEAANGATRPNAGSSEGGDGPRANIVVADSSPNFDAGALVVALLLIAGTFLVYRWKKVKRGAASTPADVTVEELLAPAARWMSTIRAHVAGRLPWTPRE
jgi:Flp pilus assembly pilin Flp